MAIPLPVFTICMVMAGLASHYLDVDDIISQLKGKNVTWDGQYLTYTYVSTW